MIAARLLDEPVFLRELLPQDLNLEIPQVTCEEAMKAARYEATIVGKAQPGRWIPQLGRNGSSRSLLTALRAWPTARRLIWSIAENLPSTPC
jgi:hypothetical protein